MFIILSCIYIVIINVALDEESVFLYIDISGKIFILFFISMKKKVIKYYFVKRKNNFLFFQKLFVKTQLQYLNMKFIF